MMKKTLRNTLLIAVALIAAACNSPKGHKRDVEVSDDMLFMEALMDTSLSISALAPYAESYALHLQDLALSSDDRETRILAQELASMTLIDLVRRSMTTPGSDAPSEQAAFQTMVDNFLAVHEQWVVDRYMDETHLFKEVPITTGAGTAAEADDFFFIDYLLAGNSSEGVAGGQILFRFPDNAVSNPMLMFEKYSEDSTAASAAEDGPGSALDPAKRDGYTLGELYTVDIPEAPGSKVAYGNAEVLAMMMEYDVMTMFYCNKENPSSIDDGLEMSMVNLDKFHTTVAALTSGIGTSSDPAEKN